MLPRSEKVFENLRRVSIACVCMMVCTLLPSEGTADRQTSHEIGIIIAADLNFRTEPSKNEPPQRVLPRGSKVIILERLKDWLKVSCEGQTGYISSSKRYVHIISADTGRNVSSSEIHKIKKNISAIDRKLQQQKVKVRQYSQKEINILEDLNQLDKSLNQTRQQVLKLKKELDLLKKRVDTTHTAIKDLSDKIRLTEDYLSRRLKALYKLERLGRIHFFASTDSLYDLLKRKYALEKILAADAAILQTQLNDQNRLSTLKDRLQTEKKAKQSHEIAYQKQLAILFYEKNRRSALLTDIRRKKSLQKAAIASLKQDARHLNRTLKVLQTKRKQSLSTGISAATPFANRKGLLKMPVKGKIFKFFGQEKKDHRNPVVTFSSGIEIRAGRGDPIRAVCSGTVIFSSWLKGYGNLIIVDHGENYYTLYAHAEELFKAENDRVETREVIATVGDTGSLDGPKLHFEVRHHDKPLNPLEWLHKG